jgi:hypothetical protein
VSDWGSGLESSPANRRRRARQVARVGVQQGRRQGWAPKGDKYISIPG